MPQSSRSLPILSIFVAAPLALCGLASGQLQFQDQTSTHFPAPLLNEYTNQASIVDLEGDLDLDIVLANGQGFSSQGAALRARVFINNGTGNFTEESAARIGSWTGWARGVEFGDCDNDGDPDMVLAQDFNKQPQLFINNGSGVFTNETATRLPAMLMSSARAQFADIENDGDLDLFFCNSGAVNRFGSGQPRMFINDGTGDYSDGTASHIPAGNITDQQDCIFGDVDGDLDLDLHITSRNAPSVLWKNNGTGVFTNAAFPADGASYSFDFGDINGDGDLDMLSIEGPIPDKLYSNNGAGVFTNISTEISPNPSTDDNDSKFFDFDNDGDLDFIVGSLSSTERVYRNNGSIATADFTQVAGIITAVADATLDVEVADLTGDGKLDVFTAQGEAGSFIDRLFVNIGGAGVIDTIAPTIVLTEQAPDTNDVNGPYILRTVIYDSYTSDRGFFDKGIFLNYSVGPGPVQQVEMEWSGNSMWRGEIPGQAKGGVVTYFVTATDYNNNLATGPSKMFTITPPEPPCLADVSGGDGEVNIDDLFAVIAAWGPCPDPCPPYCDTDIDDDCDVDIDDLFAVIAQWGPCP